MIINAMTMSHPAYRPYSAKSAIAEVVLGMKQGEEVIVHDVIDALGRKKTLAYLAAIVSQIKGDMVFSVMSCPNRNGEYMAKIIRAV